MSEMPNVEAVGQPGAISTETRAAKSPEELRTLAIQFESLLLSQMLKEMRQSMFDESDESTGFSGGPLADTMFSELSLALSRAGGVGLGRALYDPIATAAGEGTEPGAALDTSIAMASMPLPVAGSSAAPFAGDVTSRFGWRRDPLSGASRFHKGLDVAMALGQDVPSARGGTVASAGNVSGYGLTVVVDHGDRTSTRYAHLSEILVQPGDSVLAGQSVGRAGATGRATGPHLHFEVLKDGQPVDPAGGW